MAFSSVEGSVILDPKNFVLSELFLNGKKITLIIFSYRNSYQLKTYKVAASSDGIFWLGYLNLSGKRL